MTFNIGSYYGLRRNMVLNKISIEDEEIDTIIFFDKKIFDLFRDMQLKISMTSADFDL